MVKKMRLPSFFKNKNAKTSWKWPQFKQYHKTLPFQAKTVLSEAAELVTKLDSSWSTNSSQCLPMVSEDCGRESLVMAFKALRSERLFFEPGNTSSIFAAAGFPFQECVVLAIQSEDPYLDFRTSMEEMVEAYGFFNTFGVKDWECLEELLAWYLRMNRKKNHGFIVGAFFDMFVRLPSSSSSHSFSYGGSSASSSKFKGEREVEEESISSCIEKGKYPKYY